MTYLDHAATTPPDPEILTAVMQTAKVHYANPSSTHPIGKEARSILEDARKRCAVVLGCGAKQLVFTSGGSESNNIILYSTLKKAQNGTVITSGIEHPSIAEPAEAWKSQNGVFKHLHTNPLGRLDGDKLMKSLVAAENPQLVAIMAVNNETGVIQPLEDLCSVVRDYESQGHRKIHVHVDMVQAAGKIPVTLKDLEIDSASFSAHKIKGPRGVGLLYLKNPRLEPLYRGGGQESGLRPGTENLPGAVGMALALERYGHPSDKLGELGAYLTSKLGNVPGLVFLPEDRLVHPECFVPSIQAVSLPPIPSEVLARVLGEQGFAVSTGSACHSNKRQKMSRVLNAMGVPSKLASSMIRISLGESNTNDEIDAFVSCLIEQFSILKRAL